MPVTAWFNEFPPLFRHRHTCHHARTHTHPPARSYGGAGAILSARASRRAPSFASAFTRAGAAVELCGERTYETLWYLSLARSGSDVSICHSRECVRHQMSTNPRPPFIHVQQAFLAPCGVCLCVACLDSYAVSSPGALTIPTLGPLELLGQHRRLPAHPPALLVARTTTHTQCVCEPETKSNIFRPRYA